MTRIEGREQYDNCSIYPPFTSAQTEGVIDVAFETGEICLTAQPFSGKAGLAVNGAPAAAGVATVIDAQNLVVGDNPVQIEITAENGQVRGYTLHIKRVQAGYSLPPTPQAYQASEPAAWARRLAAGDEHGLVLSRTGAVAAWGNSSDGRCNMPAGLDSVIAVAGGACHSLALKQNGRVAAWGGQGMVDHGQANVPSALKQATGIAAGDLFSVAVNKNGRIFAWGDNSSGQCDVPSGLKNVAEIKCGPKYTLALRADGQVFAWGDNSSGQCDVPADLKQVVAIAAGKSYALALQADGTLVAWGQTRSSLPGQATEFKCPQIQYVISKLYCGHGIARYGRRRGE